MSGNLEKYLKPFSTEVHELVSRILAERDEHGSATYESSSRLMELGVEEDADMLIGIAYYHLAEFYVETGEVDIANLSLTSCIKYLQGTGPYRYIACAYNLIGVVMLSQNNIVMAMEAFENGLKCCKEQKLMYEKALLLNNVAICYESISRMEDALEYFDKALSQYKKAKNGAKFSQNCINCIVDKATLLLFLNRLSEAEEYRGDIEEYIEECGKGKDIFEAIIFMACYHWKSGDEKAARDCIEQCKQILPDIQLIYNGDGVRFLLQLLIEMQAYEDLIAVIDCIFTHFNMGNHPDLFLQSMKMRLRYGMDRMDSTILRENIQMFLKVYDEYTVRQSDNIIRDMEMKKRLQEIQESEYELKLLNAELLQHARHDGLTKLPNRGYLNEYAEKCFEKAKRAEQPFGICFLDIDYFKQLNDYYGHLTGDECLIKVADILKEQETDKIFCARYGGDEFTLLFVNKDKAAIDKVLGNIQQKIEALHFENINSPVGGMLTVSMGGFCKVPLKSDRLWDFFAAADTVMYQVKRYGKNNYQIRERIQK